MDYQKYIIPNTATIMDALISLNRLSNDILTLLILDKENRMVGTLTDGDIRRHLINGSSLTDSVSKVMNTSFQYIFDYKITVSEIQRFKSLNISLLPCLNGNNEILRVWNLKKLNSLLPVDAVLMAGGKGERLRPLTEKTPKPLLKVGDKSIIDYNIEQMISYGIENISVTVNYLKEQIQEHFEIEINDVKVKCVEEPAFLGTLGSIKFVENLKNDTVLIMNSDLFTNINYEEFYIHFLESNADMSVAAVPYSVNIPYGIFDLNGKEIQSVKEKPIYNYYANAGIYLIKRELIDFIPSNIVFNATDLMEMLISRGFSVTRYPLMGYWIDIGKPEDYNKAQEFVKHITK